MFTSRGELDLDMYGTINHYLEIRICLAGTFARQNNSENPVGMPSVKSQSELNRLDRTVY